MLIEWEQQLFGACESFNDIPKGATIIAVDDVPCLGTCENCGIPIMEGDEYISTEDGTFCATCVTALAMAESEEDPYFDDKEQLGVDIYKDDDEYLSEDDKREDF
jgi:hypothetical protein